MYSNSTLLNKLNKATDDALKTVDYSLIAELRSLLAENIREEEVKKSAGGKTPKSAKVIADVIKHADTDVRPGLGMAHAMDDGFYGFCDGFRAFVSRDTYGYEVAPAERTINLKAVFDERNLTDTYELDLVDINTFIKVNGIKKSARYVNTPYIIEVNGSKYGFNPNYLKSLIEFTGNTTLHVGKTNSPAIIFGENKKALCLPIRLADN